jgi:predicted PurR-regulated permease PerM
MESKEHPYEEPFLLVLVITAFSGLMWLFYPFIPALLFALLLATATYPLYERVKTHPKLSENTASFVMSISLLLLVIMPFTYLFIVGGKMGSDVMHQINEWLVNQPAGAMTRIETHMISLLPIAESSQQELLASLQERMPNVIESSKQAGVWLASNLFSGLASFATFIAISLFSLFFFYRDGKGFAERMKHLSPLANGLDSFIMRRFSNLASTLTLSVLGVALLQGTAFAFLMIWMDVPWLFLGLAYAVASFIPIVGGFLVWGPVALYFLLFDHTAAAIVTAIYSVTIIGIGIDNILRPIIISKLSSLRGDPSGNKSVLDHTWLTMLSTFAGLMHFGIMGLIFGPMLAAMAITIFDVYEHKHRHQLDYS